MERNTNYFSNYYNTTTPNGFGNNNNHANNFHNDNPPGPSQYNHNSTITHNAGQVSEPIDELRSVNEILPRYRSVFASYPCFNIIQSRVFDVVLYLDESVVVSAPTGSGKTAIFELAIVRFLTCLENLTQLAPYKIVYVAPMKALCEERLIDWHAKFGNLGLTCLSVTGDSDNIDFQTILNHNLIITTPEKWDSLTRRWRDNKTLATLVKLFLIDEVHLVSEDHRGPTLEAVVCRMKTIQDLIPSNDCQMPSFMKMRFVAVSASIPNAEDIAEWLSTPTVPARSFKFGDEMRPVQLKKVVLGYNYNSEISTPFKFDIMLSYKLQSIMLQYAEGKPTLIFCSTRKSVEMTSKHLIQNLTINLNPQNKQILQVATSTISDRKIREMLISGVCYHHAGLAPEDRRIIADLFRNAHLPILVTTSTLAMGVNLPAHLVVIKSTKYYSNGEYQDYSESMMLQMIGRAGRPQFDTSATAVILTTINDKDKFENMVGGEQIVESNLHKYLTEHLNAEVVLHTITDLGVAMQWLTSTFLYIRARKHPRHYGLPSGLSLDQIDKKLLDMCQIEINRLARVGMLTIDHNDIRISPTSTGSLMAKYCIAFETMKLFTEVTGKEILQQILGLISKCREFSEIYLRVNDKKALNLLNKCRDRDTIRFPYNGKIKTVDMKINCIIQAVFGCLQIVDQSLLNESQKIMRIGERISKCLAEYLEIKGNCYSALLNALLLAKCFHARLWETSPFVSKQLSGIGSAFSSSLVSAGKTSFKALLEANPRDIERILHRKSPMGNTIQEQVAHLPDYELTLEEVVGKEWFTVNLKICLKNFELLRKNCSSVNVNSIMRFLVGDSDDNMWLYEKFTHRQLIDNPQMFKKLELPIAYEHELKAHFISEDWVGLDCNVNLLPLSALKKKESATILNKSTKTKVSHEKGAKAHPKAGPSKEPSHIQTFMDTYFKNVKEKNKTQKQVSSSRLLLKSRESEFNNKENNGNAINALKTSRSIRQMRNFNSNVEEKVGIVVDRNDPETSLPRQPEERHLSRQNSQNLDRNTNNEIKFQNQQMRKLVADSISTYQKQNEYNLPQFERSSDFNISKRFSQSESIPKQNDSNNVTLVRLNNYSATARRNLDYSQEQKPVENNFKPLFEASRLTPIGNTTKRHFEKSLFESNLDMDKENKHSASLVLQFQYTPRKKVNPCVSPQIKHEPEANASTDSDLVRSSIETPQYDIKEIHVPNSTNALDSLKSSDNYPKTLTWRSPLVRSPAGMYSPILNTSAGRPKPRKGENISFSSLNSNENTLRHGNKTQLKFSFSVNNDSSETTVSLSDSSAHRPTLRQNTYKKGGTLPLSDQAHAASQRQGSGTATQPYENNYEDPLLSTSLLENLGLIQKQPDANQIYPPTEAIVNTQTDFPKTQRVKEKLNSAADYYSKILLDANKKEKFMKTDSDLNVQFQNPRGYQQPINTPVVGTSTQTDPLTDFDANTSFVFPSMFSPETKKRVRVNESLNSSTIQNSFDFSHDENLFPSEKLRQHVNHEQLGIPNLTTPYNDHPNHPVFGLAPSHEAPHKFPRVMSGSSQPTPNHKRFRSYPLKSYIPTQEFEGYQNVNCSCGHISNPHQEEFQFQHEIPRHRPWRSQQQPVRPHGYPMIEHDYFEHAQGGPSSSQGSWGRMGYTAPSCRNFGYNRHENAKRQKLHRPYRVPSNSRNQSFHDLDEFWTNKPNYYSQYEMCTPEYFHRRNDYPYDDKQYTLQRFLDYVEPKQAKSFVNTASRVPHGFGQRSLDFTICTDEMEDEQDEEGYLSSN